MDTIHASAQINELAAALAKAQATMAGAHKAATNPHYRSRYADLESIWDAIRVPLTTNGLSVVQLPSTDGARVSVETVLLHTSGQWMSSTLTAEGKDASPQSVGSAITYLRRYGLAPMSGVCPTDDDGEAAQPRGETKPAGPVAPDGYEEAADDLRATPADERPKVLARWKPEYRTHLAATNPLAFARMGGMLGPVRESGEEG